MPVKYLIPEIEIIYWVVLSIWVLIWVLDFKFIKFKHKDVVVNIAGFLFILSVTIFVSFAAVFYSSAGVIFNLDFIFALFILGMFIYTINSLVKETSKKLVSYFILGPLIASFLAFYFLYNEEKIFKLSRYCKMTDITNIFFCDYFHFGDTYTGEMKAFLRHGNGIYTWKSGKIYKGEWKNNKMDGIGEFSENGNVIKGTWKKSKLINEQ